ncbi:MAG: CRTAC1 family protein [Planctomycetota bacterium]
MKIASHFLLVLGWLLLASTPATAGEASPKLFEEVSKVRGLEGLRGQYIVWADIDLDGFVDLLVNGNRLYRNSGPPAFSFAVANEAMGLKRVKGRGLCVDVDNDGDLDLPTTGGQLWIQDKKGKFTESAATFAFTPPERCTGLAWFDMDNDGWLDAYCIVSETSKKGRFKYHPHRILRNEGGRKFVDVSQDSPIWGQGRYGRAVSACDYDLDGDMDLYVGNYRILTNFFLHNMGEGRFKEIGRSNGTAGNKMIYKDPASGRVIGPYYGHTIGAAWADFNNDGLFDLFVANLVHKYVGPSQVMKGNDIRGHICDDSKVYLNGGGPDFRFTDVREKWGLPPRPIGGRGVYKGDELWSNVVCGDFDNDGYVDAFVPQIYDLDYATSLLLRNKNGAGFEDVSAKGPVRVINTYGGAWADFDNDGFLDLACMGQDQANPRGQKPKTHKARLHLYRNLGNDHRWIRFHLKARSGSPLAVGAQVYLKAAGVAQVRQVEIGTGSHAQQNDPRLLFGLGKAETVDVVLVRWGRGVIQLISPLPAPKKTHVLTEPETPKFLLQALEVEKEEESVRIIAKVTPGAKSAYLWDLDGDGFFDKRTIASEIRVDRNSGKSVLVRCVVLDRKTLTGWEKSVVVAAD